jgi:hypothetical protein
MSRRLQKRDVCPDEGCRRGMDFQMRDAEEGWMSRRLQKRDGCPEEGCRRRIDAQKRDAE